MECTAATVRRAHPHDMLVGGAWSTYQHDRFVAERIPPFKQVYRELYVPVANDARIDGEAGSARRAGQQVQPRQTLALFGTHGWIADQGEGVSKVVLLARDAEIKDPSILEQIL